APGTQITFFGESHDTRFQLSIAVVVCLGTGYSVLETEIRYSIDIFLSSLKSLSILPVPSTTLHSGSSAIETGNPVSSRMRLSRFFNKAPPRVRTMHRSLLSAG